MTNEIDNWGWGNEVLYNMCREVPDHKDTGKIAGKIWLIGRSYSASIERGAGEKMINGADYFYHYQVAPAIKASEIDLWLDSIKCITRVTKENVNLVLSVHKELTNLFYEITGMRKRSLASKYLHFHQPDAFFIYDSIANTNIRKKLKEKKDKKRFPIPDGFDNEYAKFVTRCLHFRDKYFEKELGKEAHPRQLDKHLLGY